MINVKMCKVFLIKEANVTTLAQMNKVSIKFAQYINEQSRQNADILLKAYLLDPETAAAGGEIDFMNGLEIDEMISDYDLWYGGSEEYEVSNFGKRLDIFLKNNPSKKKQMLSMLDDRDYSGVKKLMGQGLKYSKEKHVLEFQDGYYWTEINDEENRGIEGIKMQHCGAAVDVMYSLRDKNDQPHVTLEVSRNKNSILQIKGKQNKLPEKKYQEYVISFVKKMKIIEIKEPLVFQDKEFTSALETAGAKIAV